MPSETEIIFTFIFKRSGKNSLSFSELYLALSMDLNWFTPDDAKVFVNKAINNKLLIKKDEMISPNFDYDKINVPLGFTPSKQVLGEKITQKVEKKEEGLIEKIITYIVKEKNLDKKKVEERINSISKTNNITELVAIALLAKEHDISLDKFYNEIESDIFS